MFHVEHLRSSDNNFFATKPSLFHVEHKDFHSRLKTSNIPLIIRQRQYLPLVLLFMSDFYVVVQKSSTDTDSFCTADLRCA
jgi:hypothetical protein